MDIKILLKLLLVGLFCFLLLNADAQCAMCKQVVDSGTKNGSTVAKGLNTGILYLLIVPFLAVGTVTIAFLKRWKATQK